MKVQWQVRAGRPLAAWYRFSGDRKGQHPKDHLARFRGWIHADGYAGFEDLYRTGAIRGAAPWPMSGASSSTSTDPQGSPIAEEAIGRIAQLYAVEKEARRALRQALPPRSLTIWSDGWP